MSEIEFKNDNLEFEERLKEFEIKLTADTERRFAELEKELPLEERNRRIAESRQDTLSLTLGSPVAIKALDAKKANRDWIWENYLAKRHITLLSALWKAGKSTLLRCLLKSMQKQEEFAGQPTFNKNVLVITEEPEEDWVEKRELFDLDNVENVYIWSRPLRTKPNVKQWAEFLEEVSQYCQSNNIDLVVIDTLSTFWPIDNENDSAQVMKALIPLFTLTNEDCAVLLIHHFRKGGGQEAQASRGSGALTGFVSNIIEFTRVEGTNAKNTQRLLRTYGRFDDVVPEIVIELQPDNTYVFKGSRWEVSKQARVERLITIFEENTQGLSSKDLTLLWDDSRFGDPPNLRTIQNYLKELVDKNILMIVREEIVVRKKTPYYALKGGYIEQLKIAYTVPLNTFVSSVNTDDSTKNRSHAYTPNIEAKNISNESVKSKRDDIQLRDDWDPRI